MRAYLHSFSSRCLPNMRSSAKFRENLHLQQFKVIQGWWFWYQSKAQMRLPLPMFPLEFRGKVDWSHGATLWWKLHDPITSTVFDWSTSVTDGRTDRPTGDSMSRAKKPQESYGHMVKYKRLKVYCDTFIW